MMPKLSEKNITYLPGVGSKRASLMEKEAAIVTCEDLLYYFPYRYEDRGKIYPVNQVNPDMQHVQVVGRISSAKIEGEGVGKRLTAKLSDATGSLGLVWFKGLKFVQAGIVEGQDYLIFGKPSIFNGSINIVHPEMDRFDESRYKATLGLVPRYNTTARMKSNFINSRAISKMVFGLLSTTGWDVVETLPGWLIKMIRLIPLADALRFIHFPPDNQTLARAQARLKFEELFFIQLNLLRTRNKRLFNSRGHQFQKVGNYLNSYYSAHIPFELTDAQKRVIREIRRDLGSGRQMNRLLQGDVGSGKTLVALMVMLIALDNHYQACLMAPTEILAMQHYATISRQLEPLGIKVGLLTGSTRGKEREGIDKSSRTGELQILVGTHALIEDSVVFKKLGLVIIDEQHRFGVDQRARLWSKNAMPPHVLVMTATPIPRTLAMTVYGDLDISIIDELPPGRKPVQTIHYLHNRRNQLNRFLVDEIRKGRQVYVVYPLIEESENLDYKSLTEGYEYMREALPGFEVVMVHGRMKPSEKDAAMRAFVEGKANVMLATTVIEVGVNVPNATVMVIESAERFGLSQLHQLRGRVGRGADQSYCVLVTGYKLSDEVRRRVEIMVNTNDGFEIAEFDLKMRGPGDLEGTQQSGLPFELKIANLARDGQLLKRAREIASKILESDPLLQSVENKQLALQLQKMSRAKANYGMIS